MQVIDGVAALFKKPHTVDLTAPDVVVVIECLRNIVGISVLETKRFKDPTFSIKWASEEASASSTPQGATSAASAGNAAVNRKAKANTNAKKKAKTKAKANTKATSKTKANVPGSASPGN